MNIPVILNGNKIILEAQADEPLMSVLQKKRLFICKMWL
jgi:hypothetical protein